MFPANIILGEFYLRWSIRKSGPVVFSRSQNIWVIGIYAGPENLDHLFFTFPANLSECYSRWSRKSGAVVFSRSQKIWGFAIYSAPENLDQLYFHAPRTCKLLKERLFMCKVLHTNNEI
jgi:hypothetical protein